MELSKELQERMVALVKRMSEGWSYTKTGRSFQAEACSIVAELPDPDLEAARRISSSEYFKIYGLPGSYPDESVVTQAALAGIKHGRGQ